MKTQYNSDKAYSLMVDKCDIIELEKGERTNVETLHEGRFLFKYEVIFCDDKNNISKVVIVVNLNKKTVKVA